MECAPLTNRHLQVAMPDELADGIGMEFAVTGTPPVPLTFVLVAASSIAGKGHS
jgi:hypothetical protein